MDDSAIAIVRFCINFVRAYVGVGIVFALVFVTFLVQRVDPVARGGTIGFRILIIPGVSVFWPLFVVRLLQGKMTPSERTAHRLRANNS